MIENYFLNFGVLGVWTTWLIIEKTKFLNQMQEVISQNTQAINSLLNYVKKC